MLRGIVNERLEAVLRLTIRDASGFEVELDAVVDTGYTGGLSMPASVASKLDLIEESNSFAFLADGSLIKFNTYIAEVDLDGWREVLVSAVGNGPLVGMSLLAGFELRIRVEPGGAVEVGPIA